MNMMSPADLTTPQPRDLREPSRPSGPAVLAVADLIG
jgi:hypothetical protein